MLEQNTTLTVPLFTQVYKWISANLMLEVTLRWTGIPSMGEQKYSKSFHATESGISYGLMVLSSPKCINGYRRTHTIHAGAEILQVASCYRIRDKLRLDGPLGFFIDFTYINQSSKSMEVCSRLRDSFESE